MHCTREVFFSPICQRNLTSRLWSPQALFFFFKGKEIAQKWGFSTPYHRKTNADKTIHLELWQRLTPMETSLQALCGCWPTFRETLYLSFTFSPFFKATNNLPVKEATPPVYLTRDRNIGFNQSIKQSITFIACLSTPSGPCNLLCSRGPPLCSTSKEGSVDGNGEEGLLHGGPSLWNSLPRNICLAPSLIMLCHWVTQANF